MDTSSLDALAHNERFSSYREMEEWLLSAVAAVRAGALPPADRLADVPLRRLGYFTELVCSLPGSKPELADRVGPWLTQARDRLAGTALPNVPFYHGDPPYPDMDALAHAWGLSRGLNQARLWQLLRTGHC